VAFDQAGVNRPSLPANFLLTKFLPYLQIFSTLSGTIALVP
jgi:hypothetical protein